MSRFSIITTLCVALAVVALGVGLGPEPPARAQTARVPRPATVAVQPPTVAAQPMTMRYDLAAQPERFMLESRGAALVDLGRAVGAAFTLASWTSGLAPHEVPDGDGSVRALVSGRGRARLIVPSRGGPVSVVLRARGFRGTRVAASIGDRGLAEQRLPRGGAWTTLRYDLGELPPGEHRLLLRVRGGAGRLRDGTPAALALDWMRVAPPDAPGLVETTPPPVLARRVRVGRPRQAAAADAREVPALAIPAGHTATVLLPFERDEPRARLRGGVSGGAVAIGWTDESDASATRPRTTTQATGAFDIPVRARAGRVMRITFSAGSEPVTLVRPAVFAPMAPAASGPVRRPRNVLIYLVDTLRADHLAPYNPDTRVQTPGLRGFVQRATTMRRAHTQECWTKPSVATMLSSLMPWEHTATGDASVVPRSVRLLPQRLSDAGFVTASFIANGYVSDRFGFDRGWDQYTNYIREGRRTQAEYVAADALQWLDDREDGRPFFLYVHTIDPHVPYRRRESTFGLYGDRRYSGIASSRGSAGLLADIKRGRVRLNARDRAHLEALYDGEITYHDIHFQAIMDGLERRNLANDTLVIVTSDHGEEFWDHGSVGHGHSVYEELLHVPMFIRHPGLPAALRGARALDEDVGLVDVVPTVLDALGLPVTDDLSGRSFLPALAGQRRTEVRGSVSGFMENWRAITLGRHKMIHRANGTYMLYDLVADPDETTDVAAAHPDVVRLLRAELGHRLAATPGATVRRARRRPRHRPEQTDIDEETAAQLRALGYMLP